ALSHASRLCRAACYQIRHLIPEEVFRPVGDIPEAVHRQLIEPGLRAVGLDEIEGRVLRSERFLRDPTLHPPKKVLGMALDDELDVAVPSVLAGMNRVDEDVCQ